MKVVSIITILLVIHAAPASAVDFTVVDVVDVGPCYGGLRGAVQWSPDGSMLAYFANGSFMVADTLGKGRVVKEIDFAPHRFVWSSNDEIILFQRHVGGERLIEDRLCRINVISGNETLVREDQTRSSLSRKAAGATYHGPFRTVEGGAYYTEERGGAKTSQAGINGEDCARRKCK